MDLQKALLIGLTSLALMTAGCLDNATTPLDDDDASGSELGPQESQPNPDVSDPGTGTAAGHGEPTQEETSTTTELGQDGRYHARKTVTLRNDFGGADRAQVGISFAAGDLRVTPDSNGGYEYVIVLEMIGSTEQEAEEALDEVRLEHTDELDGGKLRLATLIENPPVQETLPGITVNTFGPPQLRVDFAAHLPAAVGYNMDLDTSSADIQAMDIGGESLHADSSSGDVMLDRIGTRAIGVDTSSGDITISASTADVVGLDASSGDITYKGEAGQVVIDTSSGDVTLDGSFGGIDVDTSSGDVDLDVEPSQSGSVNIDTSSGTVDLDLVSGDAFGYDVQASTSSGDIDIDLPETELVEAEEDYQHVRTIDYAARSITTSVGISTSSGDIDVVG